MAKLTINKADAVFAALEVEIANSRSEIEEYSDKVDGIREKYGSLVKKELAAQKSPLLRIVKGMEYEYSYSSHGSNELHGRFRGPGLEIEVAVKLTGPRITPFQRLQKQCSEFEQERRRLQHSFGTTRTADWKRDRIRHLLAYNPELTEKIRTLVIDYLARDQKKKPKARKAA